jgi:hypothetical protein
MHGFLANVNERAVTTDWRIWVEAICTLAIYSFLYRENRFYRVFEHIMLGLGVGFGVMVIWLEVLQPKWWRPMFTGFYNLFTGNFGEAGPVLWITACVLGGFLYLQYSKKYLWLARITIGLTIGVGAGSTFKDGFLRLMPQLQSSFLPLIVRENGRGVLDTGSPILLWPSLNNLVFVVALICVLAYFFFSFEHRWRPVRGSVRIGRLMLMVSFGAFFGNAVMTRLSVFLQRLDFLLFDWLKFLPHQKL